jgi:ribosomal protein S18 acetylase RimI-like enzyme
MSDLEIRVMRDEELERVVELWQACGLTRPHNDPHRDIEKARSKANSEILVGVENGRLVASVMVGHDGHRGVVYYVSTDPEVQGKGIGRQIMAAAEDWLKQQGIWKLNLMIRADNTAVRSFYEALGYDVEERTVMAKWLDVSARPDR